MRAKILSSPLIRNILWSSGGNAVMAVVSFVSALIVMRYLNPSEYGVLQEASAYFAFFLNCEGLINSNLFKKEIIKNPDHADYAVAAGGVFLSLIATILFITLLVFQWFTGADAVIQSLTIMVFGMVFRFSNTITYYFDAHLNSKKTHVSLNIGNIIASMYKVGAALYFPSALLQAVAIPLQYISTAIFHVRMATRPFFPLIWPFRFSFISSVLLASLPLFFSGFVDVLKNRFPFVFLGLYGASSDIGLYGAGVKLTEPWLFLASAVSLSFWPKLVRTQENELSYQRSIYLYAALVLYPFLVLSLLGYYFSENIILSLLNNNYLPVIPAFKIQCITLFFQAFGVAMALIEANQGLIKWTLYRNISSVLLLILGLIFLNMSRDIMGVATIFLYAQIFSNLLFPLLFPRTRLILLILIKSLYFGPSEYRKYMLSSNKS